MRLFAFRNFTHEAHEGERSQWVSKKEPFSFRRVEIFVAYAHVHQTGPGAVSYLVMTAPIVQYPRPGNQSQGSGASRHVGGRAGATDWWEKSEVSYELSAREV
jgi:hypothetical protein